MRTAIFFFVVLVVGCGGTTGACESPPSCTNVNERACAPMVEMGRSTFHAGETCEARGYTVCGPDGCYRP